MHVIQKIIKNPLGPYYDQLYCDVLNSELVVPDPAFVWNPVTLTIRIRYSLNFADSEQAPLRPGIIEYLSDEYSTEDYSGWYALDSDDVYFRIRNWDFAAQTSFAHKFKKGQNFWDRKFMLITPDSYSGFDYQLPDDVTAGTSWRPNVLCRFELVSVPSAEDVRSYEIFDGEESGGPRVHLPLDVVRADTKTLGDNWGWFRSNSKLYTISDVDDSTLWHELGHAIDQDHIQGLLGDGKCKIEDPGGNAAHCYATPPGIEENIMGSGRGLLLLNAKPWVELIKHHTNTPLETWNVSFSTSTPPRKIPGVEPKKPVQMPERPRPPVQHIPFDANL